MKQPKTILPDGTEVRTHAVLKSEVSALIGPLHLAARRPGARGVIVGVAGGHGGDIYYVDHGLGRVGAYCFSEFELATEAAEALTLDCRTERREVPAMRILEAVRRVVDGWTFGDDDETLREHLYFSVSEASIEDADEAVTDLCEDIAEAVVKVLGGEP